MSLSACTLAAPKLLPRNCGATSHAGCRPSRWRLLVIGYGNELRGDDAAGPMVARRIAGHKLSGVRSVAAPLLLPEMAAEMIQSERVLFVDASLRCATAEVRFHPVGGRSASGISSCSYSPEALCALCHTAYLRRPESWLLEIPAARFGFGRTLSRITRRGIERATRLIAHWIHWKDKTLNRAVSQGLEEEDLADHHTALQVL